MLPEPSLDAARLENVKRLDDGSIKAACPACRASGSDKSSNHLKIEPSGKYGCAANPGDRQHRKEIFKLVGIKSAPATNGSTKPQSRIVATYPYQDASGKEIFQVVRKEPKTFLQRQPDGKGGWIYKMDGVERVLFRLPETLTAIKSSKFIFLCEGEKDVLAMVHHGFDSTCNPGGAGKWLDGYTETLRGADVVIVADKDAPGRNHAQLVASRLNGVAKSVRVLELPDVDGAKAKDASDYFTAGGAAEHIFDMVDAAPVWTPQAAPDPLPGNEDTPELHTQQPPLDIGARLAQVRFNIHTPPPLATAIFQLNNGTITHTRGNISAITAQAKAGKSALIAALTAATIAPQPENCDLLGFQAINPERLPVLLLDTEHSPEHHWKLCDRIFRRAGVGESELLHAYQLAGFGVKELNAALDHLLAERQWFAAFLDGTGDFVADVNDPEECNFFVARLHRLAIKHDSHLFNVLHLNPSSDFKSRGHLGSQLERKAETNLRIEKKDGVSVVYSDRNRGADIPKDIAPRFAWDDEAGMHVTIATQRSAKDDSEKQAMQIEAEAVFTAAKNSVIGYGQFITFLERDAHVSKSTAKRRFNQMLRAQIIRKELTGFYTLNK